jgi:phage gp45-like
MFDLGTVVHSALDDADWLGIRIDGFGDEESGLGDSELQTPFGFTSRPVDRDDNGGCDVLYAHAGNSESFAWIGTDRRYSAKCPELSQGSSVVWNSAGQYVLLDVAAETTTIKVPVGNAFHVIEIGKYGTVPSISITHADGKTSVVMRNEEMIVTCPKVHVNSPNVLLGSAPGKQVACVGDLVSVAIPAMANGAGPVLPVNPLAATPSGGVQGVGQIISGRSGVTAGP